MTILFDQIPPQPLFYTVMVQSPEWERDEKGDLLIRRINIETGEIS